MATVHIDVMFWVCVSKALERVTDGRTCEPREPLNIAGFSLVPAGVCKWWNVSRDDDVIGQAGCEQELLIQRCSLAIAEFSEGLKQRGAIEMREFSDADKVVQLDRGCKPVAKPPVTDSINADDDRVPELNWTFLTQVNEMGIGIARQRSADVLDGRAVVIVVAQDEKDGPLNGIDKGLEVGEEARRDRDVTCQQDTVTSRI